MDPLLAETMSIRGWIFGRIIRIVIFGSIAAMIVYLFYLTGLVHNELSGDDVLDPKIIEENDGDYIYNFFSHFYYFGI